LSGSAEAQTITLGEAPGRFTLDPATLAISVDGVAVNAPQPARRVGELWQQPREASWQWPAQQVRIRVRLDEGDLLLTFSSDRAQRLDWFALPASMDHLCLALGEGSRLATTDPDFRWRDEAGLVQETRFGDGSRIWANFRAQPVEVDGELLAAKSVRARLAGGPEIVFEAR
jgi:hypothetical protein